MDHIILWAASNKFGRERRAETWQRFTALQDLLHSQLQRIGELDTALGILIGVESLLFVWFLDRTFITRDTYSVVITCLLVSPLFISMATALTLRAEERLNARWLNKGLGENENVTLITAINATVEDFGWNLGIVKTKRLMLIFSMMSFLGMSVAYILGAVLV